MLEELTFSLTETKFLSNVIDDRLLLWRNTIQLFHKYGKRGKLRPFEGPFFRAGLKDYRIDSETLDTNGDLCCPDILSSNKRVCIALEITLFNGTKKPNLDQYTKIDRRVFSQYSLPIAMSGPEVISIRPSTIDDGPYCQLVIDDETLHTEGADNVADTDLREALIASDNLSIEGLPEIPITILPELSRPIQIRRGIISQVIQLFDPLSPGKTAIQIVDEGLERIADKIPVTKHSLLVKQVRKQMDSLVSNELSRFLIFENNAYKSRSDIKISSKTKLDICIRLQGWAGYDKSLPDTTIQSTLFDFET